MNANIVLATILLVCRGVCAGEVSVREFGAVGDGRTMDTGALQKAIEAGARSGAVVRVPEGRYLTGTLFLKSGVTLHLDRGAVVVGSDREGDYPDVGGFEEFPVVSGSHGGAGPVRSGSGYLNHVLLMAKDAHDLRIEGEGTIEGQGPLKWLDRQRALGKELRQARPFLMRFQDCKRVCLDGVTLRNSPMWGCHLWGCENVTIRGIAIENSGPNTDGIDIDSCDGVSIRDCNIASGDDAICFKSCINRPCRNVNISGCTLRTPWNGFKIGTGSVGDFEDIRMTDCVFDCSGGGGIRIFSVDGANIRRVQIEGITLKRCSLPIYIRLGACLRVFREGEKQRPVGTISDILIRKVHGMTHGTAAVFITGIPGHRVSGVRIEDVDVTAPGGDDGRQAGVPLVEKETSYPEPYTIYGPMPAYGIVLRHVEGCSVAGLKIACEKADRRPAVACIDVKGVTLDRPVFTNPEAAEGSLLLLSTRAEEVRLTDWQPRVLTALPPAASPATKSGLQDGKVE